jgi:hypothetical protein
MKKSSTKPQSISFKTQRHSTQIHSKEISTVRQKLRVKFNDLGFSFLETGQEGRKTFSDGIVRGFSRELIDSCEAEKHLGTADETCALRQDIAWR